MARKLVDIENEIVSKTQEFGDYLNNILPVPVLDFIDQIGDLTNVYLFSGIIRDFFIDSKLQFRDIDLIIENEIAIEELYPSLKVDKNSFGGYKIMLNNYHVDLWVIKNSWAFNYEQLIFDFDSVRQIPNTSFFNFSSIVYSFNTNQFIIGKPFLRFLRDREIDVVFEKNPYPELCVVKSFYYSERFKMKLSKKLKRYILENYDKGITSYVNIQKHHFGKEQYSLIELIEKIKSLRDEG